MIQQVTIQRFESCLCGSHRYFVAMCMSQRAVPEAAVRYLLGLAGGFLGHCKL